MTPDFSKLTENDKALLDNVINKINIGGDAAGSSIRYIGPDAEKTLVYRDTNGEIIRKLEPEGQETPVVVASVEGAASTLGKLEVEDDNLHTDVLETKGLLVNINSIEPNNKAVYTHAVGDFIIYNNDTTPVCAKVTKQIRIDDSIVSSGSNANVQNETLTDEIKAMKTTFQAGVDAVYQAVVAAGIVPSASTPEAIAVAISNLRKTPYTGTYKPTERKNNNDMGVPHSNRYVDTTAIPNINSQTYTFPSGDGGGNKDLGENNSYRYVNATNVRATGQTDVTNNPNGYGLYTATQYNNNYQTGYNAGVKAEHDQAVRILTKNTSDYGTRITNLVNTISSTCGGKVNKTWTTSANNSVAKNLEKILTTYNSHYQDVANGQY